jgi:FAD/FMN-containing dehydrogenase
MSLSKEAYQALESIVGPEFISNDPVVCYTYCKGAYGKDNFPAAGIVPPGCVVLPRSTDEVQKIVKLANRYKVPFVPASGHWLNSCQPLRPGMISLDLKRMKKLEIDDRNMYAIVEPYVVFSQLQAEAMKRGLYVTNPGGGSQVSVVGNMIGAGFSPLNYRLCGPQRKVLGVEWVLPDGEIARLGSLAMQKDDYFWGEGIGPDLRGILRGYAGWAGGLGVVTRVATKLFPFQPERVEPIGISPDTTLQLPTNRMRRYNVTYDSLEQLFDAMREIAKAGIAASVNKVPVLWRYRARSKSKEHFWEMWKGAKEELEAKMQNILLVLLIGYTSEKQLEYEERVLEDILAETGGTLRRARQTDESWLKNADSSGMWWSAGGYWSVKFNTESLDHALKSNQDAAILKKEFVPPLVDDYGDPGWFQVSDYGHNAYNEFLTEYDPRDPEDRHAVDRWFIAAIKQDINEGCYSGLQGSLTPLGLLGPGYDNHHLLLRKIKWAFDPNFVSNPPRPFEVDEQIEKYCPWVGKDWETITVEGS